MYIVVSGNCVYTCSEWGICVVVEWGTFHISTQVVSIQWVVS